MADPVERFLALWGEVADLGHVSGLLSWDQETQMPRSGAEARARLSATVAGARHARLVAPELADALERSAERAEPGSVLAAQVREARRVLARVALVPERLAREQAEAAARGHEAWSAARAAADFALFRPALERLLALAREEAKILTAAGAPLAGAPAYDAALDAHEPGASSARVGPLLDEVGREVARLARAAAASARRPDPDAARGDYPPDAQLAFARAIAERFGFDFARGRIDLAPHPFCTAFGRDDVRLTWRHDAHDFRPALFGVLHEAGHGLYEQGLPEAWQRTPIGDAASLGVHESQSRLWENLVARRRSFWEWALPQLRGAFPGARALRPDALLHLLNSAEPSLVRVEADQGTYDLHVCVRFELERALFEHGLEVADLPDAWDAAYERALGLRPRDAAEGVLQDIHWSMGAFGYFPTYTLGNLIAAQLFAAARRDLGDLDAAFARGEFRPLLGWLRERVHRHGAFHRPAELVELATGAPLSSADYLAQRRADVAEYYGAA